MSTLRTFTLADLSNDALPQRQAVMVINLSEADRTRQSNAHYLWTPPSPPRTSRWCGGGTDGAICRSSQPAVRPPTSQILQMDVGGMPHRDFLHGIELLGTKALPQIRAELGQPQA